MGGGGDTLPTAENGVTFDEEEAAADFANQLGLPPAASITQTQGEQGIPLPPAVGIPLSPAAPAVGGGMNPPHPHINKQGPQASGGGANSPPHHPPRLISDYLAKKNVSEQEFRRLHHNHLTSINSEIDHRDHGDVRIAQRISDILRAKIRWDLLTP